MAPDSTLTREQVATVVPTAKGIERVGRGGQKVVFRASLENHVYALKFAPVPTGVDTDDVPESEVSVRASREVETIRDCTSPHMVKLGPIGLCFTEIEGQRFLYFSEEFIAGRDLRVALEQDGPFSVQEVVKLGVHITDAIKCLWELGKVHRDIKPGNIMRRDGTGEYVLLDAGLAFDVVGESLSAGLLVGTRPYFSPEQFDYSNRRILDFRSDMFALGVTLYEMATGRHPFWRPGDSGKTLYAQVNNHDPDPPSTIAPGIPAALDEVIVRMLAKSPHLRFRKCDQLLTALQAI